MQAELIQIARDAARIYDLPPELVCAVIEQESSWQPWAVRYEPQFFTHYIEPMAAQGKLHAPAGVSMPTEAYLRSCSFGLMQIMGQVAREKGFSLPFLTALCDPATGIEWGCKHLASRIAHSNGNIEKALLLWNGGGRPSYPQEVLARVDKYK